MEHTTHNDIEHARKNTKGPTISADRVEGTDVYNTGGEHLGSIDDLILDKVSGKVIYAVMSFGGFLGIGEKYHPVPWSMLNYSDDKDGYVVPLDRSQLEKAPAYNRDELRFGERRWDQSVYNHYNQTPYWQ
jgi:sporulation protein YlmC with PRC-barrel domain